MVIRNIDPRAQKVRAGRLGGLARVAIHGNPGTTIGRKLGGLRSLKTHRLRNTGFKMLKRIRHPSQSTGLAELFGILAGDGHVDTYQVTMTTNAKTDFKHAQHTSNLFQRLFHVDAPIKFKKTKNACIVIVSSRAICDFLVRNGMIRGNKVTSQLRTPLWIRSRWGYQLAFLRGLFDTDGCVYVDVHKINGRTYNNVGMAFTNRSLPLLADFKGYLERMGLHPTQKTKYTVFLRRERDIQRYFAVVGSSNPKHLRKISVYFSLKGGVG